jgi:cell division protein FtsB
LNGRLIILFIMALPVLSTPAHSAADALAKIEASEQAERRIERERQFLYRAVDDLNRSQGYVQATMRGLERQISAIGILEPSSRERDVGSLLEWYRSYAEWIGSIAADHEEDLSRAYTDGQGSFIRADRYYALVDGYTRLGLQLDEQADQLRKLNERTEERIGRLRQAVDYLSSAAFLEERSRRKKRSRPDTDRRRDELYELYKDITDHEIAAMQVELRNLDELQKHYGLLTEMVRMERSWISRKTGDYEVLGLLAGTVGKDAPVSIEESIILTIKKYESDIAYFKRKIDDVSRARARIVPSGTLRSLDRMEELSDNYDQVKFRYEHHVTWLAEQVGVYRADQIELLKIKK